MPGGPHSHRSRRSILSPRGWGERGSMPSSSHVSGRFRRCPVVSFRERPRCPSCRRPGLKARGFTLLELIAVLTLLGLALGEVLPVGQNLLDRMAVTSAREAVVGSFHRVRMEAVARGGSALILVSTPPTARIVAGASPETIHETVLEEGVTLTLSQGRPTAELRFDALGLGRVASQTLVFRKGQTQTSLVVSSLGRVVRR